MDWANLIMGMVLLGTAVAMALMAGILDLKKAGALPSEKRTIELSSRWILVFAIPVLLGALLCLHQGRLVFFQS